MDSVSSLIGPLRPSVMWMFNHIRREDQEAITKDDLKRLLGVNDNESSAQLNEAFERLDVDEDGQISLEDFMTGFARFLREAPNTPGPDASLKGFDLTPTRAAIKYDSARANAPKMVEECYESNSDENSISTATKEPSVSFQHSLYALSTHNKHSIQILWQAIQQSNPELLSDFEGFVGEVAKEVEGAQRALNKQREVTKQEALQLDEEIQQTLMDVQSKHKEEKAWVQEQTSARLQSLLAEKERELAAVKYSLKELESEVVVNIREKQDLAQQFSSLCQEKEALLMKLQTSEQLLTKRQEALGCVASPNGSNGLPAFRHLASQESSELLRIKKAYEDEIAGLRHQLVVLQSSRLSEEDDIISDTESSKIRPHLSPLPPQCYTPSPEPLLPIPLVTLLPRPLQAACYKRSSGSLPDLRRMNQLCPQGNESVPLQQELLWTPQLDRRHMNKSGTVVVTVETGTSPKRTTPTEPAPYQSPEPPSPSGEHDVFQPLGANELAVPPHVPTPIPPQMMSLNFIDAPASKPDYVLKILVVGNSFVGKSSFLMRLCVNAFSQRYSSTIGVDFYAKVLQVEDKVISLQLWDTAGQERFQSVTKAYYRGAHGIILMYDIAQEESFVAVKTWINSIKQSVSVLPAAMLLVGNKLDLDEFAEREVSTQTGQDFAKLYGTEFVEASAKTGQNVGNALMILVRKALESMDIPISQKEVITVTAPPPPPASKGCCSR